MYNKSGIPVSLECVPQKETKKKKQRKKVTKQNINKT